MKHVALSFMAFLIALTVTGQTYAADAECLPGLPCLTVPDEDQLLEPLTGPNAHRIEGDTEDEEFAKRVSCDANFMNQIYGKAFLEAEREMVIANALIAKPDSVLEYTCFDQQVRAMARDGAQIFTETERWEDTDIPINGALGVPIGLPVDDATIWVNMLDDYLDLRLERVVLQILNNYGGRNFRHDFLGGAATGDNYDFEDEVDDVSTAPCDFMYNVYFVAKCDEFALNAPFMSFEEYFSTPALLTTDPRSLPEACEDSHGITAERLALAKNEGWRFASFDPVDLLLERVRGYDIEDECQNDVPIPTGVMIRVQTFDQDLFGNKIALDDYTYEEKFCANPACYFDNNENADGEDDRCVP